MTPHEIGPDALPEMRDLPLCINDPQLQGALTAIAAQLQAFKRNDPVHETRLENVGSALIATLRIDYISPGLQWLLRQKLLDAGWEEVEFERNRGDLSEELRVVLIEHKYPSKPRAIVNPPPGYREDQTYWPVRLPPWID